MLNLLEELNFKLDANSKILDFGCGEGWYIFELRKLNFQTFGIDINNSYLEAQKKLVELDKIEGKDEILIWVIFWTFPYFRALIGYKNLTISSFKESKS